MILFIIVMFTILAIIGFMKHEEWMQAIGLLFSVIPGIVMVIIALCAQGTAYSLSAQYYNITGQYQCTILDTHTILSVPSDNNGKLIDGSIEKIGVGQAVATQITDLRNSVSMYNHSLITLRAWHGNFMVWPFIAKPDDELKPITIKVFAEGK